jgi:hypothetical protein
MSNRSSHTARFVVCFLSVFLVLGHPAHAQSYSITNGAWSNAATWNTPPVDGLSALVTGDNTVTFGSGDSYTGSDTWWNGLGVGGGVEFSPNPGAGTLNITGGTLTSGGMWAGHGGTGTINQSGGTLNIGGQHMLFGWNFGSTLNLSGGTMNMTGSGNIFNFGHTAASGMNVTGSGVANLSGSISLQSGSQFNVNGGTLNLTNTTATNSIVNIANDNSLIVVQGGGVLNMLSGLQTVGTANGGLWLGNAGTTGTLNISNGTWQQNSFLRMGVYTNGNGIINQTGGTFEIGGSFEAWGSSPSAYNLSGGTFRTLTNGVQINSYSGGAMTFNITGSSGNVTMDTPFNFTAPNTSVFNNTNATLTKTGAGTLTMAGQLDIRNGALSMSNGTIETSSGTYIGTAGGTASGTMSGGTLKNGYLAGANFSVGYNGGTGTFTQSGGTNDVGSLANAVIGWNSNSIGTYTLNGGSYSATNNTYIGLAGGTGTVNVNGGTFSAYTLAVGGNGAAAGTLNLNGGTFSVNGSFAVDANGTVNVNTNGALSGGAGGNMSVQNGGAIVFNGGTGNAAMNFFTGTGGTVDVNGQALAAGSWANLIGSGAGGVLKNSSATAASIAAGNTIWIWDGATNLTIDASGGNIQIDSWITSSGQTTPTGIIKTGTNALVLTYGGNDYTGNTAVNAGLLELGTNGALRFVIGGAGTNNAVTGSGSALFRGTFYFGLAGASTNHGDSWVIVSAASKAYDGSFSVAGFTNSGGTWTRGANGVLYQFAQSNSVLSVTTNAPSGGYGAWVSYWQGIYPGFTNTAGTADPDADSFNNSLEFAFDGNPAVGSPALLTATKVGTNSVFNYVARKDPPGGATYQVQTTGNLATGWTNSAVTISNSANTNGINIPADYERKEFTAPASGKAFYRVQSTIAP